MAEIKINIPAALARQIKHYGLGDKEIRLACISRISGLVVEEKSKRQSARRFARSIETAVKRRKDAAFSAREICLGAIIDRRGSYTGHDGYYVGGDTQKVYNHLRALAKQGKLVRVGKCRYRGVLWRRPNIVEQVAIAADSESE